MGWGGFLDKLLEKLPIQGRVERWKNKLEALKKEKRALLRSKCNAKKARRLTDISLNIDKLNRLLRNKAK